ncbi:MAG TPA: serine hydrolase domain-containing protein [Thermoanaerobaculia bacterium]|nr:serine hydrolase domain-containing protein [Thermoanaerobaculia bacterium]
MRARAGESLLQDFLGDLVRSGLSSSAVALVATPDEVLWEGAAGEARPGVPAVLSTRFDLASLTKPFVATLALVLDGEGTLPLATPIGEVWPEANPRLGRRPLSDLFRHRSGILGWTPLYHRCRSLEEVRSLLLSEDVFGARAGTYSDLGYILWALTVERRTGQPLGELVRSRVLAPLGLSRVEIVPGERPDLAESRMGTGKEQELAAAQGFQVPDLGPPPVGFPQDGNARHLLSLGWKGGVPGQAGLFGGARDLWRLGSEWLAPGKLLKPEGVAQALAGGGSFAHGWWRRTVRGSAGPALSRFSFGHTGFAGNSLWIDPEARRVLVLLSSRLDPSSNINRWRRRFHTVAARAF